MTEIVKPKLAMYWAASCGGCDIAVLNIHEKILEVDANFEVVFWPVAMDAKYKDIEAMVGNAEKVLGNIPTIEEIHASFDKSEALTEDKDLQAAEELQRLKGRAEDQTKSG